MVSGVRSSAVYRCWKVRRSVITSAGVSLEEAEGPGADDEAGPGAESPGKLRVQADANKRPPQAT